MDRRMIDAVNLAMSIAEHEREKGNRIDIDKLANELYQEMLEDGDYNESL